LLISLAGGIFILIRQNGGLNNLQASLTGQNNNWWQIEPRVKNATSTNETAAKNSLSSAKNSTKTKPAPINWCNSTATASNAAHQIIFNEIAWMGTTVNYNDEWIELKNITAETLTLMVGNYKIKAKNKNHFDETLI